MGNGRGRIQAPTIMKTVRGNIDDTHDNRPGFGLKPIAAGDRRVRCLQSVQSRRRTAFRLAHTDDFAGHVSAEQAALLKT